MDSAGGGLGGRIDSVIGDGKINAIQDTSKKIVHIQNSHTCTSILLCTHTQHIQDVLLYNIKPGVSNTMNQT